jgi:starch synthase
MVTSEVVPFAKTGGLADMVGALSSALSNSGCDVRVVLPRYYAVDVGRLRRIGGPLGVPVGAGPRPARGGGPSPPHGGREEWCAVYEGRIADGDVPVYFLDHEELYGRDGIYGTRSEPAFSDNLRRFTALGRGALQLAKRLDWVPDVVHCHDWPAALTPVYLNTHESEGVFASTASVLTIHNLGYQGVFPREEFPVTDLSSELFASAGFEDRSRGVNLLRAGLRGADLLTTVSPTYAREIQTAEHGHGLDGLLRHRSPDLFGVLNGMDYQTWNPETDELIEANYSQRALAGKAKNKIALQREFSLPEDSKTPIFGMVSRLVEQKGFGDLCGPTHGSLYSMCNDLDLQFVILGTGEAWCEDELTSLAARLDNLAVRIAFDNRLAHLVEAGSDFFLMPSRYEPCGLNQMYSLRYGTLPIVRRTGGLADTVENYDETTGAGTGFVFDELTPSAIADTVGWALWTWYNRPKHIRAMRTRAMKKRFSWEDSAERYRELYQWALDRRQGRTPRTW